MIAITVANAFAAVVRFAVLRAWIFRPSASGIAQTHAPHIRIDGATPSPDDQESR